MRILVLDDNKGFREEIKDILVRHGYEVDTVGSAPAAVPRAQSGDYDFILVDYQMPQFDGVWFMNTVVLPRKTRALLVTACTQRHMINKMFIKGVSGYIIKPFTEEELLHHLDFYTDQVGSRGRSGDRGIC